MNDEGKKKKKDHFENLAKEYLDGWQRERAAFENYKKEEGEHLTQVQLRSTRNFLTKLLPILDSFELALKGTPEELKQDSWFMGYTYIKKQFEDMLREEGIEEIKTEGQPFDPRFHEAIESEEGQGQGELVVVEELQKGYRLGEYILRPARVRVAQKGGG